MQVQLRQSEIMNALKLYVTAQGINLANKAVDISFTAGRGQTGLTADIAINDPLDLPNLAEDNEDGQKPAALSLAVSNVPAAEEAPAAVASTPAQPTASLFN